MLPELAICSWQLDNIILYAYISISLGISQSQFSYSSLLFTVRSSKFLRSFSRKQPKCEQLGEVRPLCLRGAKAGLVAWGKSGGGALRKHATWRLKNQLLFLQVIKYV